MPNSLLAPLLVCNLTLNTHLPVQVVGQVNGDHDSGGGGVDAHVVRGVVQELGSSISLHIVRVVVPPPQLNIHPVLLSSGGIHHISEWAWWKQSHMTSTPTSSKPCSRGGRRQLTFAAKFYLLMRFFYIRLSLFYSPKIFNKRLAR